MRIEINENKVCFIYDNAKEQRAFKFLQENNQQGRAVSLLSKLVEQTDLTRQESRRGKLIELYTAANPNIKRQVRDILGWNDAD